jgi:hypothetical protein
MAKASHQNNNLASPSHQHPNQILVDIRFILPLLLKQIRDIGGDLSTRSLMVSRDNPTELYPDLQLVRDYIIVPAEPIHSATAL